jgi:polyisoprenoid-binding protein YceI
MASGAQTAQEIVRIPSGTWQVDPGHSSIEFEVKHMMIATVRGRFKEFEGTIIAAPDIAHSRAFGVAKAASIDTNQPDRDAHLRSPDFFDAERYPDIRFESTRIEPLGGPQFRVLGDLTIKDATREIEFDVTVEGAERDPWDNDRVGMTAVGKINRTTFGLQWQKVLESGGFLVGEDVKILIDVSAVKAR